MARAGGTYKRDRSGEICDERGERLDYRCVRSGSMLIFVFALSRAQPFCWARPFLSHLLLVVGAMRAVCFNPFDQTRKAPPRRSWAKR